MAILKENTKTRISLTRKVNPKTKDLTAEPEASGRQDPDEEAPKR